MLNVSSQDFRNIYEKLYDSMRRYLWPLATLEILADVEANIYSAFIDIPNLKLRLDALYKSIKEVMKDDKELEKNYNQIVDLANEDEVGSYLRLPSVNEVNPENDKRLKSTVDDEEEEKL